jgi:hypothetical protein
MSWKSDKSDIEGNADLFVKARIHEFKEPMVTKGSKYHMEKPPPNVGVAETSIKAYHDIYDELGARQQLVYDGFLGNGSCTNLEISHLMQIPINCVTPRTNELVKKGLIIEECKRECNISGRRSISWRVK